MRWGTRAEESTSPCVLEGDHGPSGQAQAATQETPPGGRNRQGGQRSRWRWTWSARGCRAGKSAATPSPPPPQSCLKHRPPAPACLRAPPQRPPIPGQGLVPRGPQGPERAGSPRGPGRARQGMGCEARGRQKFSVSSGRGVAARSGEPPAGPVAPPYGCRFSGRLACEPPSTDLPGPPRPQDPKPGPRKPPTRRARLSGPRPARLPRSGAAGEEGGPFPSSSAPVSFKHREAPCPEEGHQEVQSTEGQAGERRVSLLSRDDRGLRERPLHPGARPPSEQRGRPRPCPQEQASSKPLLIHLLTLTLPQLPGPPLTPALGTREGGAAHGSSEGERAERRSPLQAVE